MTSGEQRPSTGCGGLLSGLGVVICLGWAGYIIAKDFAPQWAAQGRQLTTAYVCEKKLKEGFEGPLSEVSVGWYAQVNKIWPVAVIYAQNEGGVIRAVCTKGDRWYQWFALESIN